MNDLERFIRVEIFVDDVSYFVVVLKELNLVFVNDWFKYVKLGQQDKVLYK